MFSNNYLPDFVVELYWWRWQDSNLLPIACKATALPGELHPQNTVIGEWWVWLVSNQRPLRYQHSALTNWATDPSRPLLTSSGKPDVVISDYLPTTDKCGCLNLIAVSRKEVIQPHLPIRLPCYDFTPVTNPAVVSALLAVRLPTSGETRSHGVTGGVYKTRERIHRDILIHDY